MSQMTIHMSEREDLYSKMIREGVMTRDEALQRLEKENKIHMNEIVEILRMAGIDDISFLKSP